MKLARTVALSILLSGLMQAATPDMPQIKAVWQHTLDALNRGDVPQAKAFLADFNQKVHAYATAYGPSWELEYLIGTLYCQFPDSRASGAEYLKDSLQNQRGLNDAGEQELKHEIASCTAPAPAAGMPGNLHPDIPRDIASAHFQNPGVTGNMKGGYSFKVETESGIAISPIPAAELVARRVPVSEPDRALSQALSRLPSGATGAVVYEFAVTSGGSERTQAVAVGKCLLSYTPPLKNQFQIEPSTYMVTVYTADNPFTVYQYAKQLHGLQLPHGVVAYSVPEDMSLAGVGSAGACGTLAHELVHLWIKRNFAVSPAWLEEGLASQVAVATPEPDRFQFSWSWRDKTLSQNFNHRPSVADLLSASWASFSPADYSDERRAAALQAMAAVFIRYLDSQGKLSDVYFAVRDRHFSNDLSEFKSYREIVEDKLGKNVDQIDVDFVAWFQKQEVSRAGPNSSPQTGKDVPRPCVAPNSPMQQAPLCDTQILNQKAPDPPAPPK